MNGCADPTRKRNGCRCRYKVRWFYSKGAFLILVWNLLVSLSCYVALIVAVQRKSTSFKLAGNYSLLLLLPLGILFVVIPLSGWLADAKFGNYRVSKAALLILFLGTVINCVVTLIFEAFSTYKVLQYISFCIAICLIGVGGFIYLISSLQLGLDQMPDASAVSITSFIAWFVFSISAGLWITALLGEVFVKCIEQDHLLTFNFTGIWGLFFTLCISIVLISHFLLAPKWLIVEPKSPQSLKTIYKVLKFAAKHKAPINRSALTYWEEDIPSRIDLGKSKYGGPFTTEQVEDVKTVLRLLTISLSLWVIALSLFMPLGSFIIVSDTLLGLNICTSNILHSFTYDTSWCVIIATLLFEFAIYPLVRNKLPSILKRIGIVSFLITVVSFLCLILQVVSYFYKEEGALEWITAILYVLMEGLLKQTLTTSMLEFVCAQSPYNMRGLLSGYVVFLIGTAFILGKILSTIISRYSPKYFRLIVGLSIKTVLGLIGFILHCILARWYKRRVRDDIYSPHRMVEEVYDRYLTAQVSTGGYIYNW